MIARYVGCHDSGVEFTQMKNQDRVYRKRRNCVKHRMEIADTYPVAGSLNFAIVGTTSKWTGGRSFELRARPRNCDVVLRSTGRAFYIEVTCKSSI